ncbi:MAG: hypothetical protein RLZZ221_305, partial [Verrucomicrobiota bacterium]
IVVHEPVPDCPREKQECEHGQTRRDHPGPQSGRFSGVTHSDERLQHAGTRINPAVGHPRVFLLSAPYWPDSRPSLPRWLRCSADRATRPLGRTGCSAVFPARVGTPSSGGTSELRSPHPRCRQPSPRVPTNDLVQNTGATRRSLHRQRLRPKPTTLLGSPRWPGKPKCLEDRRRRSEPLCQNEQSAGQPRWIDWKP